jgi:hypothetical protein
MCQEDLTFKEKIGIFLACLSGLLLFILLVYEIQIYNENLKCEKSCDIYQHKVIDGACFCKTVDSWQKFKEIKK